MDIAKLGVSIDPAKAVDGGKKVKEALKEIGSAAKTELGELDKAADKAGKSAKKMGEDAKRGMADLGSGIINLADGLGLLDNGWGAMVRRAQSMFQAYQQGKALLNSMAAAAAANTAAQAATATATGAASTALVVATGAATAKAGADTAAAVAANILATAETAQAAAAAKATAATTAHAAAARSGAAAVTAGNIAMTSSSTALIVSVIQLGTASASTAVSIASMGVAAKGTVPGMITLMGIMRSLKAMMDGMNGPKRLGGGAGGKVIDIDAQVVSTVDRLSGSMLRLGSNSQAAALALPAVASGAAATGAATAGAAAAVSSFGVIVAGLVAGLLALVAALTAVGIAYAAFKGGSPVAAEFERIDTALTALTGSAGESTRILNIMKTTWQETGVEVSAQARTIQKFIALGFSSNDAIKLQRNILDVAGGIGMTATEAELLGSALAQVKAKGVVSMEELRQQIAEKGIPVIQELQQKTGLWGAAFFKAVEEGKVPANELIDIFLNMEGSFEKFKGGAERMGTTWSGMFNRIDGAWKILLAGFAEPIQDSLKPILEDVLNMIQMLQPWAKEVGQAIADSISILYQAISDGRLEELIVATFMAGLETVADGFTSLFWGVITYLGEGLGNTLGEAADAAANAFMRAFTAFIQWLAEQINKVMAPLTGTIAEKLGLGTGPKVIGPIAAPKPVNFFEPSKTKTLAESIEASQGLVGTTYRDQAAKLAGDLLIDARKNNSGFAKDVKQAAGGGPTGTGDGKDGKGEKAPKAKEVKELDTEVQKLIKDWTDLKSQMDQGLADIGRSIASNLTDSIVAVAQGTKDLGTAFADMATSIVADILRIIVQMYVQLAVAQMLAALGYGGTGGAGYSVGGQTFSAHTGGTAGSRKLVTSGGFGSFHTGGVSSGEQMVKVEKGETVLTRKRAAELEDQLSARQNGGKKTGGGQGVTIMNITDASQVLDTIAANPDAIVNAISKRQPMVRKIVSNKERT